MKLIRISTEKFQLKIKQRLVRFFGLLLIAGCTIGFLLLTMQYEIHCEVKKSNLANHCILKRTIFDFYQRTTNIGQLKEARVESSHSSKGKDLFAVYLYTDSNPINLSVGSSSGREDKENSAQAINNYIKTSMEKEFSIPYPPNKLFLFLDAIFFVVGLLLLSIKDANIIFDKSMEKVTVKQKNIWGQTDEMSYPLNDVDQIIVEENKDTKGSSVYRLAINLKDNGCIPLISTYDSAYLNKKKIADELNQFIHSA
ncbi:Uncharacterised protein [Legionella wadsworthii]|uniref:Transmembrane protein n=1 Tax=Legionella wadsworthii TaxID=28088 RepID=A0A378LXG0_9GAMM|nr:hypothetical protein [Legionella wadsworthii]STY31027.1 Uncharacterised protein [Legionella wadsworthii]